MVRIVLIPLAIVMLALGALFLLTPIPLGVPLLGLGGVLLIGSSARVARWVQRRRMGADWLDRLLRGLEARLPKLLGDVFRRTRPPAAE